MKFDFSKLEKMKQELQKKVQFIAENFSEKPKDIVEYLKFKTKFYNYSSRNCSLIYQQRPGAVFCNSFKAFKDMGYSVKKGEHGMKILVPTIKTYLHIGDDLIPLSKSTAEQKKAYNLNQIKSEQKLYFKVGTVFDITQTNCPPQDYPKYIDIGYSSEQHAELYKVLKNYCKNNLNCPVNENNLSSVALRGYYDPENNEISISKNFDDTTKLSILSHETGHAVMHKSSKANKKPTAQIEFEADAVSIMLHTYMGIEIVESRQRHISNALKEMQKSTDYTPEMLTKSLEQSHKAFKDIVDGINQEFNPELIQHQETATATIQQPILPNQISNMGFTQSM